MDKILLSDEHGMVLYNDDPPELLIGKSKWKLKKENLMKRLVARLFHK
jgi:hypothetical protein